MKRYVVLDKAVGQTPLACAEAWRVEHPEYTDTPLAYAGRLDPMASGKLLVLIGDECKRQAAYHALDKQYHFEVLFGVGSDTGDVLGLLQHPPQIPSNPRVTLGLKELGEVARGLRSVIELPYPPFSSKTVQGKPLHVWTLEGRLQEITIPTYTSTIYQLSCQGLTHKTGAEIYAEVSQKIETIPPVTEASKALGNDFRRPDVRASWQQYYKAQADTTFTIARFACTASSGTYMRTLAEVIAKQLGTTGLAYSIHRTKIGRFTPLIGHWGIWIKTF